MKSSGAIAPRWRPAWHRETLSSAMIKRRVLSGWRIDVIVLTVYALLTIVLTWPVVQHLSTHFIGNDVDVWINPWADWWIEKALREGRFLFFTDLMYYPRGVSLYFHSFSYFNTALAWVLRPLLGTLGAANTTILLAHILSGYGTFCLARYVTRSNKAAFVAGLVYAFFPYRLDESSHPVIVSTQWLPFYLLYFIRCVRENCWRFALWSALFLILTALVSWHLFLFALLLSLIYVCYVVVAGRKCLSKVLLARLMLLGTLTLVVLSPLWVPMLPELTAGPRVYYQAELSGAKGNDLLGFFLPAQFHPVWGSLVAPIYDQIQRRPSYLGWAVLGLAVLAIWRNWHRARFWAVLLGLTVFLSIGPHLVINGQTIAGPLPWSDLIVRFVRHPFRLNVLVGLATAVLSGLGVAYLLGRLSGRHANWSWAALGVISAVVLFDYLAVPFPTVPATMPEFFVRLAARPGSGAVLSLPMGRQPTKPSVFYQTVHGRPIVEGVVSRTPTEAYDWIEDNPILRSLRACERYLPPADLANLLPELGRAGIDYVTLYPGWVPPDSLNLWRSAQSLPPEYEDPYVIAYSTQVMSTAVTGTRQLLDDCLGVRLLQMEPHTYAVGDVLSVAVEWAVGNKAALDYRLRFSLIDERGDEAANWDFPLYSDDLALTPLGVSRPMAYSLPLSSELMLGQYRVNARLRGSNHDSGDSLKVHLFDVQLVAP